MNTKCIFSLSAFEDYLSIDLTPSTIITYKRSISYIFRWLKKHPKNITIEDVEAFVSYLMQKKSSAYLVHLRLSALTSYYTYLRKKKVFSLGFNIMEDVKKPKIIFKEQYIAKSNEVFHFIKLLESEKHRITFARRRDIIAMLIATTTGARINEIRNIKIEHIDFESKQIAFYKTKNKKPRVLFLLNILVERLEKYLADRNRILKKINKTDCDYLFVTEDGKDPEQDSLLFNLRRYSKEYNIKITWHSMRRGFATDLANNGVELEKISKMLGHSSVDITASRYIYSNNKSFEDAIHKHPLSKFKIKKEIYTPVDNSGIVEKLFTTIETLTNEVHQMRADLNDMTEYKKASTTL